MNEVTFYKRGIKRKNCKSYKYFFNNQKFYNYKNKY